MKLRELWKNNEICPQCGGKANPDIKANETGCNYCSVECAGKHVRANEPNGGY